MSRGRAPASPNEVTFGSVVSTHQFQTVRLEENASDTSSDVNVH